MDTEEPSLPPNPELLNRQPKWFKPVLVFVIITSALLAVSVLLMPLFIRDYHRGRSYDQTEATSNARQIGFALMEFDTDYGSFPNTSTAALVTKNHSTHGYDFSGTSSNSLFLQLFAASLTQSEQIFYARIPGVVRPDDVITPGEALKKGEVGFSYISGLSSIDADPLTPLVLTPLIPGTTKFDPKPFDGKAIILHIDNFVRAYDIHKDGHVYDKGIDLLSAKHPVWKGKAPDIRCPE